jgi:hypothetical protein
MTRLEAIHFPTEFDLFLCGTCPPPQSRQYSQLPVPGWRQVSVARNRPIGTVPSQTQRGGHPRLVALSS